MLSLACDRAAVRMRQPSWSCPAPPTCPKTDRLVPDSSLIPSPHTLREKAAQLVMARLGSNMPPPQSVEEDAGRVRALLERCPLGGLVLFNGALASTPAVLTGLQAASRIPLLVGTDMERGVGQQVTGATVFPHARAFGALGEEAEALVERAARAAAREALACGIQITFAPVADVNLEARNPIIATRAFADEPEQAARLAAAYVRGCRAEGLLSTAKHFPGHGRTAADSHAELPVIRATRAQLEAEELPPFRAALKAGAELVMTGHVVVPSLDASAAPATASAPILKDLLRDELGFEGAVITDSLLMAAIRERYEDAGTQAAELVAAGVDVLLDATEPEAMVDGLVRAVEGGQLPVERLDEAVGRVLALKQQQLDRHGAGAFTPQSALLTDAAGASSRELAREVARRAVTVVRGAPARLPLDPEAAWAFVRVTSRTDRPAPAFEAAVRGAFPRARYAEVGPDSSGTGSAALRRVVDGAAGVVLVLVIEPAAWHPFGLTPGQRERVRALVGPDGPLVAAALGSPHVLDEVPGADVALCTYSDVPVSQEALVDRLLGRSKAKPPV